MSIVGAGVRFAVFAAAVAVFAASWLTSPESARGQALAKPVERQLTPEQKQRLAEAERLNTKQVELYKQRKYRESLVLAKQVLATRQELLGDTNLQTATAFQNLGRNLEKLGRLAEARPCHERAIEILTEARGNQHLDTAMALTYLGLLLDSMGDFVAARPCLEEALAIREGKLGDKHRDTAAALNNLGLLLSKIGEYDEARQLHERALAIHKQVLGDKHLSTAGSLNSLGVLLKTLGDLPAARLNYEQALAIRRSVLGEHHPDTAVTLNNLGKLLQLMGDFATAKVCFEQALASFKQAYGDRHPKTAWTLNNIGLLLQAQGSVAAARPYLEQALDIRRKTLGPNNPDTGTSLNNLGMLLQSLGDFDAALACLEEALRISRTVFGDKHSHTARALQDLGTLMKTAGNLAAARPFYEQALALRREVLGEAHLETATAWNDMGSLQMAMNEPAEARRSFERSLAINKQAVGDRHPYTAAVLNHLAQCLHAAGDSATARKYVEQALIVCRESMGSKHPATATLLEGLSVLQLSEGEYESAATSLAECVDICQSLCETTLAASSEADALNVVARQSLNQQDALLSIWELTNRSPDELYAHLWPARAAVFQMLSGRQRELTQAVSPETRGLYQSWLDARRAVSRFTLTPADADLAQLATRRGHLEVATRRKEQLERDLAAKLPDFARQQAALRRPHADLVRALPRNAAFVDILGFWQFQHDPRVIGTKEVPPIPSYTAFILQQDQSIRRVELGSAGLIDNAVRQWREAILAGRRTPATAELQRLVWQPIAESLSVSVKTVYLVPDGPLASLPWAALPGKRAGSVVLEDYALALVPNGQLLLDQLETRPVTDADGTVLAVGGVLYDVVRQSPLSQPQWLANSRGPAVEAGVSADWKELPGTLDEIDDVARLAGRRKVVKLSGEEASTTRVLQELPSARWAVFATHGFFAGASFRSVLQLDEHDAKQQALMFGAERALISGRNPFLLSGLVLAGANRPRSADSFGVPQGDGGILTAEGIAGLPLQKLDLAILSACETGLGDVGGREGVFGLQRAFHQAGCRNVVASLWKVDDQATSALMRLFYFKVWQENKPPLNALREAQLALYRHPEQIGKLANARGLDFGETVKFANAPADPNMPATADVRLWAAFMLSGAGL